MKNWQLILTASTCGVIFTCTVGGTNLLTPTVSWTVGVLSLYGLIHKRTHKIKNS
jgi:hypothetical protein